MRALRGAGHLLLIPSTAYLACPFPSLFLRLCIRRRWPLSPSPGLRTRGAQPPIYCDGDSRSNSENASTQPEAFQAQANVGNVVEWGSSSDILTEHLKRLTLSGRLVKATAQAKLVASPRHCRQLVVRGAARRSAVPERRSLWAESL